MNDIHDIFLLIFEMTFFVFFTFLPSKVFTYLSKENKLLTIIIIHFIIQKRRKRKEAICENVYRIRSAT